MKKGIFLASVFTVLTSVFTTAQNAIGVRIGTNWNNVTSSAFNNTIDFKTFRAGSFGIVAELPITDNFSIQPEINYASKGFRIREGIDLELFNIDLPVGVDAITRIRYIDMPLMGKYTFGTEGVRAYVMAGPTVGYATSGALETRAKVIIDFKIGSTLINLDAVNYQRFEIGGVIGWGAEFPVGNGKIFADMRYTRGFKEVYDVPVVGAKVSNQGFGVGIGYKMNFGESRTNKSRPRA
jgi:hypothetical protein